MCTCAAKLILYLPVLTPEVDAHFRVVYDLAVLLKKVGTRLMD